MTETAAEREARLGDAIVTTTVYAPAQYPGEKVGPGRWVTLTGPQGVIGDLWCSDTVEGIGFVPRSDDGIRRVPEFYTAFSGAAGAGTPAREVFDYWADRASIAIAAGPVQTGDLGDLEQ